VLLVAGSWQLLATNHHEPATNNQQQFSFFHVLY